MKTSPLHFNFPVTASIRERLLELNANLTFFPGIRASAGSSGLPASCRVHSATIIQALDTDDELDLPDYHADELTGAAQEGASRDIDAISAEAMGRLRIEKENAEVRAALGGRLINQPVVEEPAMSASARRMARELAELG